MEDWQIELISKNLAELIKLTNCHTGLLARFETCRILGREDLEQLNVPVLTRSQQTHDFYNIIKTRKNSFETLLKALNETNQSGALGILSGESCFDDTEISYDVYNELGQGSYGTMVYKGKIGDRAVAVKMVHSNLLGGVQAMHEVKMLKDCDAHENVVRYFGAKRIGTAILIVLELCDMSLKEWVENKYDDIPHVDVLRQMTTGLEWLHSQNIVHRDIKPENVLIIRSIKRVKLSDFGLSRRILEGNSYVATSNAGGTPGWMPPEILTHLVQGTQTQCKFTYASDVFSLGCVYYYVLSDGKFAFGDAIRCQGNILDGKSMITAKEIQHGCSQNTLFINLMILQDPKSRPTCKTILSYPLFWSQNRRVRFIEMLVTQVRGGMEKISSYTTQDPCRFDHSAEIRVLRDLGCPANQGIGCVLPFAYTQYTTEQVEQLLEGASSLNLKSAGEAKAEQLDKPSDSEKTSKEIAQKMIKEKELEKKNQLARGVPRPAEMSKTSQSSIQNSNTKSAAELNRDELKLDEATSNRGTGKTLKATLPELNELNSFEDETQNCKPETLKSTSNQENVSGSVKNLGEQSNKPASLSKPKTEQSKITVNPISHEKHETSNLRTIQSYQNKAIIDRELNELKRLNLEGKHARLLEIVKKEDVSSIKGVLEGIATKLDITKIYYKDCYEDEKSLLHVAVERGDYDVFEYLLNNAFEKVLSQPRFENSLVHECIEDIHEIGAEAFTEKCRILELLFTKAPQLIESRTSGYYNYTPLHVATEREFVNGKQLEFIEMLLSHNPKVNPKESQWGNTPLHLLFDKYNRTVPVNAVEIMRLLITHNANPDALNLHNQTFLHYASAYASPSVFHQVVVYLVSIHKTNSFTIASNGGYTVLHLAVGWMKGDPLSETLQIFKTHPVDFNALGGYNKDSVMFNAIQNRRSEDFLNTLIRFGADWTIKNNKQETALHVSVEYNNLSALKLFISLKVDVNAKNIAGNTPLHQALFNHDIVAELVSNGADPTLKNNDQQYPIDLAKERLKEGKAEQRTVQLLENASRTKTK